MIGQPTIVSPDSATQQLLPEDAVTFRLDGKESGPKIPDQWPAEELRSLIRSALNGRLALRATGQPSAQVPLSVGDVHVVKAEEPGGIGGIVLPAIYGVSTYATAPLASRQLYDVALREDGGRWHVVAPHAAYHRDAWTDFGIAHITDMHVARRIDGFRETLRQIGRPEAADRMYNWNDRFRGFIRYANYLHRIGHLDVIVATGDLYDYLYERDDDHSEGGNARFLRQLILGEAPGPDFPDVEELLVPIFMVPGNHDYRENPYLLVFDLRLPWYWGLVSLKDLERVRNYSGYNLSQSDAIAWQITDGHDQPDIPPNLSAEEAAYMVKVDPDNEPYKRFLADRRSYCVCLGKHRIVMLDSACDVGVSENTFEGLKVILGWASEDEVTFVGGSPNSEGVSDNEFDMAVEVLGDVTDDALVIVGLHAPLFNVWKNSYPYFLRETQRPHQGTQTHTFLARFDSPHLVANDLPGFVQARHPSWFGGEGDGRAPSFVKRLNNEDQLDYGVSRGRADDLMALLAGVGSLRAADVVLAGHTHRHNEFSVRPHFGGELAYHMDFYTHNPPSYYPTTYTKRWKVWPPDRPFAAWTVAVDTEETYVEVVPGSAADAMPWPMPYDAGVAHQLQVPPYPNPLSSAPDPRAWWSDHRPLVLQTGALGPLDNSSVSFSGFRLLSVRDDVIEKIHFVPIDRLEQNGYRLGWDDAVRPAPVRAHLYVERSRPVGAPRALGAPSGIANRALGATVIAYRDRDGSIHELWQKGSDKGTNNLTRLADDGMRAAGDPSLFIDANSGSVTTLYRGKDGHVYSYYWSTGAVGRDSLSKTAGAPKAAGNPRGMVLKDGSVLVVYRGEDTHLHSLWWSGTNAPQHEDLTRPSDAPGVLGDPAP
ncbi:MAG: metallophosphoesterase [Actinomycetota bacterium]|nr:metallophosphoesterase [Actinomycetota bacterium]